MMHFYACRLYCVLADRMCKADNNPEKLKLCGQIGLGIKKEDEMFTQRMRLVWLAGLLVCAVKGRTDERI